MVVGLVLQMIVCPETVAPDASLGLAVICAVWPETRVSAVGVSDTDATVLVVGIVVLLPEPQP
jgi:hypothetical protein